MSILAGRAHEAAGGRLRHRLRHGGDALGADAGGREGHPHRQQRGRREPARAAPRRCRRSPTSSACRCASRSSTATTCSRSRPRCAAAGAVDMFSGEPLPERLVTANAYLGALPIARALDAGADIVITGRCVDSAVTLGVLMHEFGWARRRLRPARRRQPRRPHHRMRLPGHGRPAHRLGRVPDWANIGYPIVECRADGSFVVTKPPGTGGLVTPATVGEQLLYEIGDPAHYLLPDVVCDFRAGAHGAGRAGPRARHRRARPPADRHLQGQRHHARRDSRRLGQLTIVGIDAPAKAQRTGEALLERGRRLLREQRVRGLPRHEHRAARHRVRLRPACAAAADAGSRCCA